MPKECSTEALQGLRITETKTDDSAMIAVAAEAVHGSFSAASAASAVVHGETEPHPIQANYEKA